MSQEELHAYDTEKKPLLGSDCMITVSAVSHDLEFSMPVVTWMAMHTFTLKTSQLPKVKKYRFPSPAIYE